MNDDGEPGAAEVFCGQGIKEDPGDAGRPEPTPGHTHMVQGSEHAVSHPVPLTEHAIHLGQQYAPEEKLFAEDVERYQDEKQTQDPPSAFE